LLSQQFKIERFHSSVKVLYQLQATVENRFTI